VINDLSNSTILTVVLHRDDLTFIFSKAFKHVTQFLVRSCIT